MLIAPVHDWAVETMFDRIEAALATGTAPQRAQKPLALRAKTAFLVLKGVARLKTVGAGRRGE